MFWIYGHLMVSLDIFVTNLQYRYAGNQSTLSFAPRALSFVNFPARFEFVRIFIPVALSERFLSLFLGCSSFFPPSGTRPYSPMFTLSLGTFKRQSSCKKNKKYLLFFETINGEDWATIIFLEYKHGPLYVSKYNIHVPKCEKYGWLKGKVRHKNMH